MSSLWSVVVIYIFVESVYTQRNHSLCVWGRDDTSNYLINGEYQYKGDFNGAPYFEKAGDPLNTVPILYAWRDMDTLAGQYIIARYPPESETPAHFASCVDQTLFPWLCSFNQWEVYGNKQWSIDPQVYASNGSCPEWFCDAISANISYARCDETFDIKIGRNAWSNQAGDRYFWFSEIFFEWQCTSNDEYKPLSDTLSPLAYAEPGWVETTGGSTVSIPFQSPSSVHQINCIEFPTIAPSTPPSQAPSTEPTLEPSTHSPSSHPSAVPSVSPTSEPSSEPTIETSTESPSPAPSDFPSQSPSAPPFVFPFKAPSNHPSFSPTSQPQETGILSQPAADEASSNFVVVNAVIIAVSLTCICLLALLYMSLKRKKSDHKTAVKLPEKRELASVVENEPHIVHIRMDRLEVMANTEADRRESQITMTSERSEGKVKGATIHHHADEGCRQRDNIPLHAEADDDEFIVMGDDEITSGNTQQPDTEQDVETRDMMDDFVVMADDE